MTSIDNTLGIACIIDEEGTVQQILDDSIGLFASDDFSGGKLLDVLDGDSIQKSITLIHEIKQHDAIYNREMHVQVQDERKRIFFSGIKTQNGILLFGLNDENETEKYLNGLMKLNNEHINELRLLKKEQSGSVRPSGDVHQLYDKISRVNNELMNTRRKLTKRTAELEQSNKLKNKMFGMAVHDLRSPLTVIKASSELLLDDFEAIDSSIISSEHLMLLREIYSSSKFMEKLINNMVDMSKFEDGSITLNYEQTDIISHVKHSVSINRLVANKKDIDIRFAAHPDQLSAWVDQQKFEQVVNNLLSNAIKYSYEDSIVEVKLEKDDEQETFRLIVKDEGQGIPEKEQDKLFKPFSDLSVKSTSGEKSSGLGLAICKGIVEAHGGSIWADSKAGEGASFIVELPAEEKAPPLST